MPDGTAAPPPVPGGQHMQVGQWIVEPALNQLSAAGTTVRIEPKVMALLVYLAERPGQVVSREALLAAVWPGMIVGDDSLTQAIIKLRKALGDVPGNPAYIQTIAKRGYRLVAKVVRTQNDVGAAGAEEARPPVFQRKHQSLWIAGSVISVLLVMGTMAWWSSGSRMSGAPEVATPPMLDAARATQPTVAVRAFDVLGDDPQATLLAQGLTADLATDLSKVAGLSVIGAAGVPGSASSPVQPARYLVSGSVQRIHDRLRLHVNLADVETGKQLWSERFDRSLPGFFAIQEELGPKILEVLPAKVSEAELRRVAQRYTRNLEAYEYFQHGQAALLVRQKAENATGREMFRQAIALDPAFARAYSGLALTYAADYRNQWTADGAAALRRASEMAETAHQMNPDIPEPYWVLAFVHVERRQHNEALQYLETAIRLYPSFADGYALMGGVNTYIGRPADTIGLLRAAMRLNPQAGHLYFLLLGRAYLFLGDLEQARVNLEQANARNPVNLETHVYLAALHVAAGDKGSAAWEAEEIRTLHPGFTSSGWLATSPMTDATQRASLANALGELGL